MHRGNLLGGRYTHLTAKTSTQLGGSEYGLLATPPPMPACGQERVFPVADRIPAVGCNSVTCGCLAERQQ